MVQKMTSVSHPLRIDAVTTPLGGLIGMTFCPGKKQVGAVSGNWDRDLAMDLDRVRDWGSVAVVTLMEEHELARYRVGGIGGAVSERGMKWYHLPITDVSVPGDGFEEAWTRAGPELRTDLAAGHNILLHCLGGLGRTGTIAARLLIELSVSAEQAIQRVRQARPGTIETDAQETYIRRLQPIGPAAVARVISTDPTQFELATVATISAANQDGCVPPQPTIARASTASRGDADWCSV